jgi:hypothetical protein
MNPRDFAREPGYDLTIALTYSFDPIFFENVVLHDLRVGGSGCIVIVGDPHEVDAAISNAQATLEYLGRRYMLSPATHSHGAFHPKLMLRLGREDGQVLVGSGNVTSGGWGGNLELGTHWKIGPLHDDKGQWIISLLTSIETWCLGEREREAITRAKLIPWVEALISVESNEVPPVLYSQAGNTLARQLATRWSGRKFKKLLVATGSSDDRGAMLRWAHDTFGVTHVVLAGTPSSLSLDPKRLEMLPCGVRIKPIEEGFLHAKFYWFEGPDGSAVVFGSANCSAAAWLLDPAKGGNIETVVCFDEPDKAGFSEILGLFAGKTADPVAVLVKHKSDEDPDASGEKSDEVVYRITTLDWNAQFAIASFVISPPPPDNARLELTVDDISAEARCVSIEGGQFQSNFIEGFKPGVLYGYATLKIGRKEHTTAERWVDCVLDLERSRSAARTVDPLFGLEEERDSNGQRKLVNAIRLVVQTLFSDSGHFPDPTVYIRHREKDESVAAGEPVPAMDPLKVLCDLSDMELEREAHARLKSHGSAGLSLSGILSLLFSSGRHRSAEPPEVQNDPENDSPSTGKKASANRRTRDQLDEIYIQRLSDQVSDALDKLAMPEFAQTCSAVQFVQATAFPLAVAELGRQQGWVSRENAGQWAIRLFAILFRGVGKKKGLLGQVQERYSNEDKLDVFKAAVGDGSLWAALVASLANARWEGAGAEFEKALAARELFREPVLLETSSAAHLLRYAKSLRSMEATEMLSVHAPAIVSSLENLETALEPHWGSHLAAGTSSHMPFLSGDLLWRRGIGWAFVIDPSPTADQVTVRLRGKVTQVKKGFYLNVSELARQEPRFAKLIKKVIQTTQAFQSN